MYRQTSRQRSLLDPTCSLPIEARTRLEASWGQGFQQQVYPLLLSIEDSFGDLYAEDGRPNWSVARMLGVVLLQEMLDLPDQKALDQLSFDLRWHRALDLAAGDAYLSRRSLVAFRSRLVAADPEAKRLRAVFTAVAKEAVEAMKLSVLTARQDSTHIISNIHTRGRVDLFSSTLRVFMRMLTRQFPSELVRLPEGLVEWSNRDDSWDIGSPDPAVARTRLIELAQWLVQVRDAFSEQPEVSETEPYKLVVRLISEHITVQTSEPSSGSDGPDVPPSGPGVVIHKPAKPGSSLQSPHDPDAGYGYKGPGYEVQVVETCHNDGSEIIIDFDVHPSGVTDHGKAGEALDRLAERGHKPDILVDDAGYISGEAILDAEARNVILHGPVNRGPLPEEIVGRDRWSVDSETGRLSRCPEGHPVERHGPRTNPSGEVTLHAFVSGEHCRACPLAGKCVSRPPNNKKKGAYHVEDSPQLRRRDQRLTEQQRPEWKDRYRIRGGIEATNSELKRAHGLGRLRVRRGPRVRLAVAAKLTACNIKRWLRAAGA
jgi:hypothetical protein